MSVRLQYLGHDSSNHGFGLNYNYIRVGSNDLGYGPGLGLSLKLMQTSNGMQKHVLCERHLRPALIKKRTE